MMSLWIVLALQLPPAPRVYVTDSQSWQVTGRISSTGGFVQGGSRPQTAEIIKTLQASCRGIIITRDQDRADYVLLLEREGGKRLARKDNKWVLFTGAGDALGSGSTRTLGSAARNACDALKADWNVR